jgi:transketolase
MEITNKALKRRIIEISYKHKLSHLGSCLTAVDIIKEIYDTKKVDEKFVLSSGHAGLALYVVLESLGGKSAEDIYLHHGVHPDRCLDCGLDCSTGSLGHGLPIAVGMALADRAKNVYCLISDGEAAEGSIWESLRIVREEQLDNLRIYLNWNNWAAYRSMFQHVTMDGIAGLSDHNLLMRHTNVEQLPFLKGQSAHYHVMSESDYLQAMEVLS